MPADPGPSRRHYCQYLGCDKSFTRRDYLERHAVNHSSEKPFACPKCAKCYARADVLKRHLADHPRERLSGSTFLASPRGAGVSPGDSGGALFPFTFMGGQESMMTESSDLDPGSLILGNTSDFNITESVDSLFTWYNNADTDLEPFMLGAENITEHTVGTPTEIPLDGRGNLKRHAAKTQSMAIIDVWGAANEMIHSFQLQLPVEGWTKPEVSRYIELYFLHFDKLHPLIHRPTIMARGLSPYLFIAVACLGTVLSTTPVDAEFLAKLQLSLRFHLLTTLANTHRPKTDVLLALFLINYYGNNYCSEASATTGQMFHSAAVTAAKAALLFTSQRTIPEPHLDPQAQWHLWAEAEERIRLAWAFFTQDCFGSGVLRETVMLQCYSITSPFPCEESRWNASSSQSWQGTSSDVDGPHFRPVIRQILANGSLPDGLSDLNLWIVLHALVTLTWALSNQGPDMFTLARRAQITTWKASVFNAIDKWQRAGQTVESGKYESVPHSAVGLSISNICLIALLTDLDSVRILAGAQSLNGRLFDPNDRTTSREQLEGWAQSSEGRQSCWTSITCLRSTLQATGSGDIQQPYLPTLWCIYIATLTLWVYTALIEERTIAYGALDTGTRCRIEANLARKSALEYLDRIHECGHPVNLPEVANLDSCTAVVAYAAYLCGRGSWGGLAGPTRVLYSLLKNSELSRQQHFADC